MTGQFGNAAAQFNDNAITYHKGIWHNYLSMRLLLSFILQAIDEDVVSYALDSTSIINSDSFDQSKNYMVSLVTLLIVNLVVMFGNFIFDLVKHRKDNHNYKVHLIAEKGIEVESSVYMRFQEMTALQPGDEHDLLDLIISLDSYLNTNRLYIEKKYLSHSIEFLDYLKSIQHKMALKDVNKEELYFGKLSKAFYGE